MRAARLALTATLPWTRVQLAPPSVDLNRPTPASESAEPFGSPVPAYRVLPEGSLESTAMEPIAFEVRPLDDGRQLGEAASPLSVAQIPPPAAPTHTRQTAALQFGSTAIDVTRPALTVPAPGPGV